MNVLTNGTYIITIKKLVIIILIITGSFVTQAQHNVLDTRLSFKLTDVRIASILKSVSRRTGYYFTYDTDLIEPEKLITVRMDDQPLRNILDTIFYDKLLNYSIIDNHIIIYQSVSESTPLIREEGKDPVYSLSGIVTDADNGQPLPYATIGVKEKGKGTISNHDGEYNLNLTKDFLDDTLIVSYLGFYNRKIPVNQAINSYYNISLTRMYVPIPEVIIRNREPQELIRNVKERIPENYGRTPARMIAFYRESVSKRNKLLQYSEAVLDLYKSSYTTTFFHDQIRIYKSRKINNLDQSDTLTFKLRSGLDGCLALDGIKNTFDFLEQESFADYNYRMTDIINIGDEAAFVVEFEQKENINDIALPKGSIYINTTNYGIHAVDFEINQDYINQHERTFIQQMARGFNVKVRSAKYRVNYRNINDRYYLNHVRGDLEFYARKKNRMLGSTYYIFFEMAITDIDTVNVERFAREERAPLHSIFSETINSYDRKFWGTDNFVRPEENIEDALSRISARLAEYSSNNSQ
ncbi:MAG: carboxypeptidase-like regulatory domain-containing protein [Bacteroidales bacterium]|nr:carboxypeptidase-like regulatory domain-containing protein [Bacteroidales bacterium]